MNWYVYLAKLLWSGILLISLLIAVILIVWIFPPEFFLGLALPSAISLKYLGVYLSVAIGLSALLFATSALLVIAWVFIFRYSVGQAMQLTIVQSKFKPAAPVRRLAEFVIKIAHGNA